MPSKQSMIAALQLPTFSQKKLTFSTIMEGTYPIVRLQRSADQLWLHGDRNGLSRVAPYSIGMQTLVNILRRSGSRNVFVLDGLHLAATLEGLTPPNDPLHELVYAVHPYQHGRADTSQWAAQFQIPSRTYPVWADEWGGMAGSSLMLGNLPNYDIAVELLNHLRQYGIPVSTLPFDVKNFTTTGPFATVFGPAYTPTNYDHYSTTEKG